MSPADQRVRKNPLSVSSMVMNSYGAYPKSDRYLNFSADYKIVHRQERMVEDFSLELRIGARITLQHPAPIHVREHVKRDLYHRANRHVYSWVEDELHEIKQKLFQDETNDALNRVLELIEELRP